MKMKLKSLSKQQITNNSPPFQFSPLVRHERMVKRNPYVRRKNQPIPNRRYKTNKHRPNNEGTVMMPTVAADPDPAPSHTRKIVVDPSARLIVNDVHTVRRMLMLVPVALLSLMISQPKMKLTLVQTKSVKMEAMLLMTLILEISIVMLKIILLLTPITSSRNVSTTTACCQLTPQ
jgi:hypothetical protein